MKFRRRVKMLGSILDAAPFASVFFLLVIFVLIAPLIYTPGINLELPAANDLSGTDKPTITIAVDATKQIYFANQVVTEKELKSHLSAAVATSPEPLTLLVKADKSITYDYFMHLTLLARDAGIRNAWLALLPRLISAGNEPSTVP